MREPALLQQIDRTYVLFRGKRLSYFAGCDYYRMASHPSVREAVARAADEPVINVAASRLTTGNHKTYLALERELKKFFKAGSATLVQTGYLTNFIAAQTLAGQFSHALIDSASHVSLKDAGSFLGCPLMVFPSRDPSGLKAVLARCGSGSRPIILTDGLFARDGSIAPLREYLKVAPRDAMFLVDEAHAAGVVGKTGRGAAEFCPAAKRRIIQTVTLSKAFGAYGGAILGDQDLRARIFARSTIFGGSTPLPLPLAAAALESVRLLAADGAARKRLHANASAVRRRLRDAGYDLPDNPGPMFSLCPKTSSIARQFKKALLDGGIFAAHVHYPGVPKGGIFRFAISSEHTKDQLERLASVIASFSSSDLLRG